MLLRRTVAALSAVTLLLALTATAASAADFDVDIRNIEFNPDFLEIEPGDTVTWTNNDPEPHTVTADDGSFAEVLTPGETFTRTFNEEAYVPYFCEFHGLPGGIGQAGAVRVGDAPVPVPLDTSPMNAADNVGASVAWSQRVFPDGGPLPTEALLGRDDVFADSLASGALQGQGDGRPLLLTPPENLDQRVANELERLGAETVIILGGTSAISPGVESALNAAGYDTERVSGSNRFLTATAIAQRFFPDATQVFVARAFGDEASPTRAFADSLAAGALAARVGVPIILSATDALSEDTANYLSQSDVEAATVIGGTLALSATVVSDLEALGLETERVSGPNRSATAAALAGFAGPSPAIVVIDGESPNAWAAGFPAAAAGQVVLLATSDTVPADTLAYLAVLGPEGVAALCAPFVPSSACNQARVAASTVSFEEGRLAGLDGREEVGGGHAIASGTAGVFPTDSPTAVCYDYEPLALDEEVTAAHIHQGARGVDGPPVLTLNVAMGPFGYPAGCSFGVDAALVADIMDNPAGYYINLHTSTFPDGAIRGQLFAPVFFAGGPLSGDQVVPGPGHEEGEGFSFMTSDGERLCVGIFLGGFGNDALTGADVLRASAGEDGPSVLELRTPINDDGSLGCYDIDAGDLADVIADPSDFAVQVTTEALPQGAARAQMFG